MKKPIPSSVLNKPGKVSNPFSSLIIAHFLWMCSIFLKFCLYFSTKFPVKNYAKKRFIFFFRHLWKFRKFWHSFNNDFFDLFEQSAQSLFFLWEKPCPPFLSCHKKQAQNKSRFPRRKSAFPLISEGTRWAEIQFPEKYDSGNPLCFKDSRYLRFLMKPHLFLC